MGVVDTAVNSAPLTATEQHVEVIPMQEELEVRLEEGNFPVPADWSYDVRMDSELVAAALGPTQTQGGGGTMVKQEQPYQVINNVGLVIVILIITGSLLGVYS